MVQLNCRCMVLYKPADGDYIQNIWSKNKYRNEETMQNMIESEKREKIINEYSKKARILDDKSLSESDALEYLNDQSKIWEMKLTEEEKSAISKYTWNGKEKWPKFYERVNAFLRGILINDGEQKMLARYSEIISESLQKSKINEDIVVFRTCDKDYFENIDIGESFRLNQFMSTSITREGPFSRGVNYKIYINKIQTVVLLLITLAIIKSRKNCLLTKEQLLEYFLEKGIL